MVNSRILIPIIGFGRAGGYRVLSQLASSWVDGGCVVDFLVHEALAEPYFPTKAGIRQITRDGAVARAPKDARAPAMASVPRGLEIYRSLLKGLREIGTEYDVILANHSLTTYPRRKSTTYRPTSQNTLRSGRGSRMWRSDGCLGLAIVCRFFRLPMRRCI
jgi:hypothetical protein